VLPALLAALFAFAGSGCDRRVESSGLITNGAVRGEPIGVAGASAQGVATNPPPSSTSSEQSRGSGKTPVSDIVHDGFVQLGWDRLSGFKFDVYEFYSETNSGRAALKSDDTIPADVKSYDGRKVAITGFVLPLRIRRQLVTEFLLLRDQGTCCFGAQAQINHFIRVKLPGGFRYEAPMPVTVSGTLRVGESYVQGYLTGIYQMAAEQVQPGEASAN
jgi:hypothetical protein